MQKILHHPYFIPWFLFLFFTTIYFSSTVGGMNSLDGSQFALTQALVEQRTIKINSFMKWTYNTDYSFFNNQYFADRDPGLSFLAIPSYIISKILFPLANKPYGENNIAVDNDSIIQAFTYLTASIWGAIGIVFVYLLSRFFSNSKFASLVTAIIAGLGTLMWKYSAGFYREPVFTALILISFYFLFKSHKEQKTGSFLYFSGLFSGLSIFVDYSKPYIIFPFLLYIFVSKKERRRSIFFYILGLILPSIIIFTYNYLAFNNPFVNPHLKQAYLLWMNNSQNLFQTPLLSSVITNLFSNKPIESNILNFHWSNPEIAYQMGSKWATIWQYKGIFVQIPILFLSFIGWFTFLKNYKTEAIFLLINSLTMLIINSKLTVFWAGSSYDTRYFLPASIIVLLGLPFFIDNTQKIKLFIVKLYRVFLLELLVVYSFVNGWYSNITSFAPHISGEHRFSFDQLAQPFLASNNFKNNLRLLFINTFPNIYNLHILFIFYFFPILLIYLLYKFYLYLLSPKPKRLLLKNKKNRSGTI